MPILTLEAMFTIFLMSVCVCVHFETGRKTKRVEFEDAGLLVVSSPQGCISRHEGTSPHNTARIGRVDETCFWEPAHSESCEKDM